MGPGKHLKYSSLLAGLTFLADKDISKTIAIIGAGTLVDLDHLYEYYDYLSFRGMKLKDQLLDTNSWEEHKKLFMSGEYFNEKKTVKVLLHSWELGILLAAICLLQKRDKKHSVLYGITIGYLLHLVLDFKGNNLVPLGYFETFRALKKWNQDEITKSDCAD